MSGGCIRRRGDAWELRYELPRGPDGRRCTRTETTRSKRAAQARLRELLGQVDRGVAASAGRMTTGQWLGEWLAECKHTVSPKTWQERADYVKLHLAPALGAISLARLAPADIQRYLTAALTTGKLNGKGGLSPQTVLHHERVLHTALERARKLRLIAVNACADIDPPRVERAATVTLSVEQQMALLAAARGTDLYVPVLLAVATGLRRGELLGLVWANVDPDAGLLRVAQVVEQTRAGVRIKPPKTDRSRRVVPLPQTAIDALRRHKVAQAEQHLRYGMGKPDLLFPRWAADPREFSKAFARLADRAEVDTTFHGLRHGHVSDLLAAGLHPKVVSERAGHSSVGFTLDRYAHTTPAMHAAAMQTIEGLLRRALGSQAGSNAED